MYIMSDNVCQGPIDLLLCKLVSGLTVLVSLLSEPNHLFFTFYCGHLTGPDYYDIVMLHHELLDSEHQLV